MQKMCAVCGTLISDRELHYVTNDIFLHNVYKDEKGLERHCYEEYNQRVMKNAYSVDNIRKSGW